MTNVVNMITEHSEII